MRFKVGDRVRIKSLDWYHANKDKQGKIYIHFVSNSGHRIQNQEIIFSKDMAIECGTVMTIEHIIDGFYIMKGNKHGWTDEMIEGLVEEEEIEFTEEDKYWCDIMSESDPTTYALPQGYQFRDENGNVIEAKKIVLEKKKPKYPESYKQCLERLDYKTVEDATQIAMLLSHLERLLVCRDAYWKLAGEEMGLGKPWKPNDSSGYCTYAILRHTGHIMKSRPCADSALLEFPTEEMRDAFYENFKDLIEECKEFI